MEKLQKSEEQKTNTAHEENGKLDVNCPICDNLMVEPCLLPCNHRFCMQCINKTFDNEKKCPLCMTEFNDKFKIKVDKKF